jgi:hypothetical protein
MMMVLQMVSRDGGEWVRGFEALNHKIYIEYLQ